MPQELQVLRCYSCQFFQVHIVKKSRKWECKMCGEKQSMKKVYGRGSGQDCRAHVQKLNKLAILQQENQTSAYGNGEQSDHIPEDDIHETASADFQNCRGLNPSASSSSKWSVFLDKSEKEDNEEENLCHIGKPLEQNAEYSSKSFVRSMENEVLMHNAESTAFRNGKYYQNQRGHLNENLNSNIFKCTADPNNIYKSIQEDSLPKSSQNKWFQYVDKATNVQRSRNVEQFSNHNLNLEREKESLVFKRSNNWDMCLEKQTCETKANELVETSAQLINNNKISELIRSGTVQSGFLSTTEKQMLPRKDITVSVNATAREYSSSTFDRDYNEDELNSILDI